MHALTNKLRSFTTFVVLLPVHAYRKLISPMLGPRCKYYPTCSAYAVDAVKEYGAVRGAILASWRVMRCNPMSDGGFDYVEDQKLFRKQAASVDSAKTHKHVHGPDCGHGSQLRRPGVTG